MGLRYSKSVVATIDTKQLLLDSLDIIFIRSRILGLAKSFNKSGIYFVEKAELKWAFNYNDTQVFKCMTLFDPAGSMRISCLDLWGALTLTGTDAVQDKMDFCFKLMDLNNDSFMGFNDMYVLFMCITRGITRLRGYPLIAPDYIHKLVMLIFQANAKLLNENGEIFMKDFRNYILANELVRTYLSSLGTKVPPVDTAAIVIKRSNLQLEAANCRAEIAKLMGEIEDLNEDFDSFVKERGGDAYLTKMTSNDVTTAAATTANTAEHLHGSQALVPPSTPGLNASRPGTQSGRPKSRLGTPAMPDNVVTRVAPAATVADAPKNPRASLVASLRQVTKPLPFNLSSSGGMAADQLTAFLNVDASPLVSTPADHFSNKYFHKEDMDSDEEAEAKDIAAFKAAGAARNLYGDNFKTTLFLLWCKLPHDDDNLACLDEFTIMALFEAVGVTVSHYHATLCLQSLSANQINRFCFEDVLKWYRFFGSSAEVLLPRNKDSYLLNTFDGLLSDLFVRQQNYFTSLDQLVKLFAKGRSIIADINELDVASTNRYPNANGSTTVTVQTSGISLNRDQNLNLKWVDYRSQNVKKPSVVMLKYYFGHPEIIPIEPTAASEAPESPKRKGAKKKVEVYQPKFKSVKIEDIVDWRFRLSFAISSNPFTNLSTKRPKDMSRIKLKTLNKLNYDISDAAVIDYIEDYPNLQAQDLLDFMNLKLEQDFAEAQRSVSVSLQQEEFAGLLNIPKAPVAQCKQFASVTWFCIELRQRMHYEQELMLIESLRNYFNAIPFHLRCHLYSDVFIHGFYAYNGDYKSEMKANKKAGGANMVEMMKQYMKSQENEETATNDEHDEYFNSFGKRVVLVALYHEKDHCSEFEKNLVESDIFVSRTIVRGNVDLFNRETLSEMFDKSKVFEHYEDQLFGPQENELGEEGMNPLKFAKNIRMLKKGISENIEKIINKTISREEATALCKVYGCRDSGALLEVSETLLKCLQVQMELVGHGELSQFGKSIIDKIFHKFKASPESKGEFRKTGEVAADKDIDSGMLLWEFNKLLAEANCSTIYDQKEYRVIMSELQLLLDKSGNMKSEGLMNYYVNNGRIAVDNKLIGVGALDEGLKGKFVFNLTYESDALASLLSLIGKNNILTSTLTKYIAYLCGVRDIKAEGELETFSELFSMLQYLVIEPNEHQSKQNSDQKSASSGNPFKDFFELLKTPGWLASFIHKWSEFLADGVEGIIPTMRQKCRELFADKQFDQWETLFKVDLLHQTKQEVHAMEDSIKEKLFAEALRQVKERRAEDRLVSSVSTKQPQQPPPVVPAASTKTVTVHFDDNNSYNSFSNNSEDIEDEDDRDAAELERQEQLALDKLDETTAKKEMKLDSPFVVKVRKDQKVTQLVREALPPLADNNTSDLVAEMLQLKDDLIFLADLVNQTNLDLTLHESKLIVNKKVSALKRIDEITAALKVVEQQLVAHSCAAYDAIRLFGRGVSSAGYGSKDFCIRGSNEGMNILDYLPKGLGEFSPAKQAYKEKTERAQQRKAAALAALERERIRRNMTEEEKEAIRQKELEAQRKLWEQEEIQFYQEACAALFNAREERKSSAELTALVKLWEDLMALKETRHSDSLQVAVCQNNLACVLLEFYGVDHPLGAGSVYILQSAMELIMKNCKEIAKQMKHEKLLLNCEVVVGESDSKKLTMAPPSEAMEEPSSVALTENNEIVAETIIEEEEQLRVEPHELMPTIVILANYLTTLVDVDNFSLLRQSFDLKIFVYQLLQQLSVKDREKVDMGVINTIASMDVFCCKKPKVSLAPVIEEIEAHITEMRRRDEEERLRELEAAEKLSQSAKDDESTVVSVKLTKAQQRKLLKEQHSEQRRLDTIKRYETSQQRNMLYELIRTDKITQIFNAKSNSVMLGDGPKWGSTHDLMVDANADLKTLAMSMSMRDMKAEESKKEQQDSDSEEGSTSEKVTRTRKTVKSGATVASDGYDYESSNGNSVRSAKQRVDQFRVMAKLSDVLPGSPAAIAGIEEGDELIEFGDVSRGTPDYIKCIARLAASSLNVPIAVVVGRGNELIQLDIVPRTWGGKGVLGCRLTPKVMGGGASVASSPTSKLMSVRHSSWKYRGMVVLSEILPGSPVASTGLEEGDELVEFGQISRATPEFVKRIAQLATESVNKSIPIVIRRGDDVMNLQLTPKVWEGRGLLGCRMTPLQ